MITTNFVYPYVVNTRQNKHYSSILIRVSNFTREFAIMANSSRRKWHLSY